MRYSALVQDLMGYARYGDHEPMRRPEPGKGVRYSDAQLYALAQYLYSLQPPPNPHPVNDAARRGEKVFRTEGCHRCHAPPLYTNNRLIAAEGFEPSRRRPQESTT
jgi:mono/diheme cytochrome c family protein